MSHSWVRRLLRLVRRLVGTQAVIDLLETWRDNPLRSLARNVVTAAGEDGILTCTINGCRLHAPAGLLMMYEHALQPRLENPLCYVYENDGAEWLAARLAAGAAAADVGASGGVVTAVLARKVGPAGRVVAFEPAARAHRLLTRLVALNNLDNVVVEQAAVAATVGQVEFCEYPFDPADELPWRAEGSAIGNPGINRGLAVTCTVPATTLDAYWTDPARPLRALKIDVEGFEVDVLRGAQGVLERDRPALAIDIHRRVDGGDGDTEALVRELLAPWGYRCDRLLHVLVAEADRC